MMIFQKKYKPFILSGEKEWTIRKGDRRKRMKIGAIHKCKTSMFTIEFFARIRIKKLIVKRFDELDEKDAKDDLFDSVEEMKEELQRLNGEITDNTLMTKINFELVKG